MLGGLPERHGGGRLMAPQLLARSRAEAPARAGDAAPRRWATGGWWITAALLLSLALTVRGLAGADADWRVALGRLITAHGLPATEPFSYQPTPHPWVAQGWLLDVLLSRLWALGGAGLTMVVMGAAGTAALLLAALAVRRAERVPGLLVAGATLVSAIVAAPQLGVTGATITALGAAVCLLLLTRWREGATRAIWLLPAVVLVWANLDPGFVAGLGLVALGGLTVAVRRRLDPGSEVGAELRPLSAALVLALAATLATPAGVHVWSSLGENLAGAGLGVTAWQSPGFHTWPMRLLEVEAVGMVVLWALSGRLDPLDAVLGLAALAVTLGFAGAAPILAVVALPQLAHSASAAITRHGPAVQRALGHGGVVLRRPPPRPRALPAVALAVAAAAALVAVAPRLTASRTAADLAASEPVAAADYVAAHLAGDRLYSSVEWGGYLALRFPTGRLVGAYGPPAATGATAQQRALDVHQLKADWQRLLEQDGVTHAVLPQDAREVAALEEVGWLPLCHDAAARAVVLAAGPRPAADAPVPDATRAPACTG
ncbi:MAG TPA: hypothetical protein VH134_16405 [Candidatus Dormibacteraeota bacterium]|nr:hypothetical protein [Candidatus Dormibacteraeota bacterium]